MRLELPGLQGDEATQGICVLMVSIDGIIVMQECRDRGIDLRAERGQVRWKAKNGAMTVELLRRIKAREAELVSALTRPVRVVRSDAQAGRSYDA